MRRMILLKRRRAETHNRNATILMSRPNAAFRTDPHVCRVVSLLTLLSLVIIIAGL